MTATRWTITATNDDKDDQYDYLDVVADEGVATTTKTTRTTRAIATISGPLLRTPYFLCCPPLRTLGCTLRILLFERVKFQLRADELGNIYIYIYVYYIACCGPCIKNSARSS